LKAKSPNIIPSSTTIKRRTLIADGDEGNKGGDARRIGHAQGESLAVLLVLLF
jgi:hypothetical protein